MRARGRYWLVGVVLALLVFAGASQAGAQVQAVGQQGLSFGMVVPGAVTAVPWTDVTRRAEWLLTGRGRVTVTFVLPTVLTGPGGAAMPLVFGATDAAWQRIGPGGGGPGPQPIDPHTPFEVNVPNRQTVQLYLGGAAQPTAAQAPGDYSATITVIVAQP